MAQDPLDGISSFLLVAKHSSFTKAARVLGVSSAAVSQAIAKLEARLGLPLFQRTTRSVSLTEAGAVLHQRVDRAAAEIGEAIDGLGMYRRRPAGTLRITVPRIALPLIVEPILEPFRRAYPDIAVEVSVDDAAIEIAARGFDAGIRLGESVAADMVAVRLTREIRWAVLGSPRYFAEKGRPETPEELTSHECILYRFPTSGTIHRWKFVRGGSDFTVEVPGKVITTDSLLLIGLARRGVGLTYSADLVGEEDVAAGRLECVLEPFLRTTPGLFLYFPARMQAQPKLRAFIDMVASQAKRTPRVRPSRP